MNIMLFAGLKEKVKNSTIELNINEELTASRVRELIGAEYPSLKDDVYMMAVNEEFVTDDYRLKPTDNVALIPPVSGG